MSERSAIGRLVPLGLVLVLTGCDRPTHSGDAGDLRADSIGMYREMAAASPGDPRPLYNLGTVLLTRGRYDEARRPLELALRAGDDDLRQRAHYNLGNTRLEWHYAELGAIGGAPAAVGHEERSEELRRAAESYREALRIAPADVDAKWNLELALRRLEEERLPPPEPPQPPQPDGAGGGGGGGGGGQGGGGGASDSERANQPPRPQTGSGGAERPRMTQDRAEELLADSRDREVGVQRETLRKPQPQSSTAH